MWRLILVVTITVIVAVVALLPFLIRDGKEERGLESLFAAALGCQSLPEHGLDDSISLQVSRIANHPGVVCVRIYNQTRKFIHAAGRAIRLECRWFGLFWVPYVHLRTAIPLLLGAYERQMGFTLQPGTYRDRYLLSPYDSVLAGQCRVRLRYQVIPNEEEHTVYSAAFSLP